MSRIVILGGGGCALAAGLLLARDDHDVTLLERDPAPVPASAIALPIRATSGSSRCTSAGRCWSRWSRVPPRRGSRLGRLLDAQGIARDAEVVGPARFVYYTRYFRGPEPELRAPRLTAMGSVSIVTLVGDNSTYSLEREDVLRLVA